MRTRYAILTLAACVVGGAAVAQQRPVQQAGTPASTPATAAQALTPAGEQADSGVIMMREVFSYQRAGRRDPFATLLTTSDLRPGLHELRLTGVLVHPTRPVAVMRDTEGTQYRVTTGMTVGRARVVQIKPKTVIFAITQYGHERRDSLVLGDTAQARP